MDSMKDKTNFCSVVQTQMYSKKQQLCAWYMDWEWQHVLLAELQENLHIEVYQIWCHNNKQRFSGEEQLSNPQQIERKV